MKCLQNVNGSSGRATQCNSGSTTNALDDEDEFGAHCSMPPRYIGEPLIVEAASKVDKCLARLQSLQGTVTVPKVHVSATSSASTLSPIFSRSRSCLHASPKVHDNDKIRIHDVLRWSDDFSGKYKQERREKYMRRLSRSKTEMFDDKKDPLDPHGEWKHWSSPAGDVHKVISEILMASQIAKQITSMVSAAIVSDVSSDEGKRRRRWATRDTATSPNPMTNPGLQEKMRKGDPLHKFRVVVAADGPAKKRSNVGTRKEVLYPKSKQPIPDRFARGDESETTSSVAKKMQSRRSPRPAVKDTRPQEDMWSARDITNNNKSQQPKADMRVGQDVTTNSKSHQSQANVKAAKEISNSKSHQSGANVGAVKDITKSKSNQPPAEMWAARDVTNGNSHQAQGDIRAANDISNSKSQQARGDIRAASDISNSKSQQARGDIRAANDISNSKSQQSQAPTWAAKEITNANKSHASQPDARAVKHVTNSKSRRRAAPWPESKKVAPANEKEVQYTMRQSRSSRSPPRTLVEKPQLSTASGNSLKPTFKVKQGSRGPQHVRMEQWAATSSTETARAEPSSSEITPYTELPGDTFVPSSRTKEWVALKALPSASESPLSSATISEMKFCDRSPSALPVEICVLSSRAAGSGDVKEVSAPSAASPEIKMCDPSSREEFLGPAPEGFTILMSTVPESITCSGPSSPQLQTPVKAPHPQPVRPNPALEALRQKFFLEATEIKGPKNPWRLSQSKTTKAVLFSNPAFAPASPNGARPASEQRQRPVVTPQPQSPPRSTSAPRRVLDRIGRAISAGRRSISPEITRRLHSTRQQLMHLSPRTSLPSLISRLPSRGKRKPSPVPRVNIVRSTSCARPAPMSGELPLPPGRKSQQPAAAAAAASATTQQRKRMSTDRALGGSPAAASDSSSYFSLRMLKDVNSNARQQPPFKNGSKGTTPDIAPRASISKSINAKQIKCHTSLDWENKMGVTSVLSSCRKWVEESAPPLPGGVCRYEKENVEPSPERILIKDNVVATGWDDEPVDPPVLSTSGSRKLGDNDILPAAGGSYATPGELKSSSSGVRRSSSTGRLRTGASFLRRARDWMRTQTPNRMRTHSTNWDQPRQSGLVL